MAKRDTKWIGLFRDFVRDLRISSKEVSSADERGVKLDLWESQELFLQHLADGLEDGIRWFINLKSRQLGITTISLAIDVFWLAMHPNLTGALVSDTDKNRNKNREQIERYVRSFPDGYFGESFTIERSNVNFIKFSNGSRLDFLVAGTKAKKSTSWGEGEGYAYVHCTEVAAYGDADGLASFMESFAQKNPDRLFIFESTAKGFNHFRDLWKKAKEDLLSKRAFFIGWWACDMNRIERTDPRFQAYGKYPAQGEERDLALMVAHLYNYKIQPEQLAWIRWKQTDASSDDPALLDQNQPWVEDQAFIQTGFSFFPNRQIAKDMKELEDAAIPMLPYYYELGNQFFDVKMVRVTDEAQRDRIELKVWEQPNPDAQYVIGCDPAYGRNAHKDRSVASVWRCYADKIVQVAEYATSDHEVKHCAWVLAHLGGAYQNCIINVELTGPGRMIIQEWEHIAGMMKAEMYFKQAREREWENALDNARWYLYHRPDSMGAGYAYGWECLALDTKLPTPTGWTTMGDVKEGDFLLSDTGKPTKVLGLSEVKTEAKCYEIVFDDGTRIVADENHWWKVARRHWWYGEDKLRQTKQLEPKKFYIRQAEALELPDADLPIDPYLLGVWLGDGTSAGASISWGDQDVVEMSANIEACGQPTGRSRYKTCWRIGLNEGNKGSSGNPFMRKLRALDLLNNKHIPEVYLRASYDQRLALLQGLMDTDGTIGGDGGARCAFITNRKSLVIGFSELIRSLGYKAKFLTRDESIIYKGRLVQCNPGYQFWFTPYIGAKIFRLRRKQERIETASRAKDRKACHRILSVTEVPSVPVRCVMVDSPTSMFLAGDGMVPTHNTTWRTKSEIMHQTKGAYLTKEIGIRSFRLLDEMTYVMQDGDEIGAPESRSENCKDDRVFAMALATRAWLNWAKVPLIQQGLTYEVVRAKETGESNQMVNRLNDHVFRFFKSKQEDADNAVEDRGPKYLVERGLR